MMTIIDVVESGNWSRSSATKSRSGDWSSVRKRLRRVVVNARCVLGLVMVDDMPWIVIVPGHEVDSQERERGEDKCV